MWLNNELEIVFMLIVVIVQHAHTALQYIVRQVVVQWKWCDLRLCDVISKNHNEVMKDTGRNQGPATIGCC